MTALSNERKFIAPAAQADVALCLAGHFCLPDPQYPVGSIRSIYYDSPRLIAYQHKLEGDNLKRKVRLRWYAGAGADGPDVTAFLELKYRTGSARHKDRIPLRIPRAWIEQAPVHDFSFRRLLQDHWNECGDVLPLDLHPVMCIGYDRYRYVCPRTHTRVCVDTGIFAERINTELLPGAALPRLGMVVCEFKDRGQGELPWAHKLYAAGFRLRSFSKYGACLERSLNGGI